MTTPLIFFDGPDGSRKTSLIEAIEVVTGLPTLTHTNYLPYHDKEFHSSDDMWYMLDHMKTLELLRKCSKSPVIVDRHPVISELVYSNFYGRVSPFKPLNCKVDINDYVVLCYLDPKDDKQASVLNLYHTELLRTFPPGHVISCNTKDMTLSITCITDFICGIRRQFEDEQRKEMS